MFNRARAVIFDLDGTLADTAPDILTAANRAFEAFSLPNLNLQDHRNIAGKGRRAMISMSTKIAHFPPSNICKDVYQQLYARIADEYAGAVCIETALFDGARELLEGLSEQGFRLGVCTNKPHNVALELLKKLGLDELIDVTIGKGELSVFKPDPLHLLSVAQRLNISHDSCIFVGDTSVDIKAAEQAKVPFAFFECGYEPEARTSPQHYRFDHFNQLRSMSLDSLSTKSAQKIEIEYV
ncbi:hypothetical protein BWR17_19855 (plasmid) [Phaeobacter inhibens]|uniref:HAD family hydrolase n=1 Tax=Phaeobacter inhibens TaxID=221822 RepID=UPI000971B320|nr:HAD-IA family hydrolase [Phaeobacter inhibens]APX18132.1 hypothetical protein BWR17_19855 [Phaeobacter inhibens]